jgi:hypothetical protein
MRPRSNYRIIAIGLAISVVLFLLLAHMCNAQVLYSGTSFHAAYEKPLLSTASTGTVTTLVFTWQANPLNTVDGVNMWPACGATLTTCIAGETIVDITVPASPVTLVSGISPTVLTYSVRPLPAAGVHNYCLEYNAYDQSGKQTISSCDQASVTVPSMVPNHPVDTHAVPSAPASTAKPSLASKVKKALHL